MLKLSGSLLGQSLISLRTGGVAGSVASAIIDPNNLKIVGFYVMDNFSKQQKVLLTQDIRDITAQGIIIDDHAVLTEPEELIRLQDILKLNFELLGKPVQTIKKEKLGRVSDFAADDTTLYIQKLYVSRSLLKSISSGQLSIDRSEIIEVTNKRVIIRELLKPSKASIGLASPAA